MPIYLTVKTAREAQLPQKCKKLNSQIYCCVNISLTKNALEHVHLEDELVQNQLLIG